jgi:serine/threonine protein kinase
MLVYFAMELYPASLATALAQGPLPEPQLLSITRDVAEALAFAHAQGVVHRDIKPDNILLGADGRAVVSDFGIARAVSGYVSATGVNMTIGTPHYLSPEQAQGRPLDGRSDLYSLGITLYKAATGDLPFKSKDWYELARMHVEEAPAPPRQGHPDLSKKLERIILRLLAKHPDDRPASAEELLQELDAMQDPGRDTRSFKVPDAYKGSVTTSIPAHKPGAKEGEK